jgi:hypothetical protein
LLWSHAVAMNHERTVRPEVNSGRLFEDRDPQIITEHRSAEFQRIMIPAYEVNRHTAIDYVSNRREHANVVAHNEVT